MSGKHTRIRSTRAQAERWQRQLSADQMLDAALLEANRRLGE